MLTFTEKNRKALEFVVLRIVTLAFDFLLLSVFQNLMRSLIPKLLTALKHLIQADQVRVFYDVFITILIHLKYVLSTQLSTHLLTVCLTYSAFLNPFNVPVLFSLLYLLHFFFQFNSVLFKFLLTIGMVTKQLHRSICIPIKSFIMQKCIKMYLFGLFGRIRPVRQWRCLMS